MERLTLQPKRRLAVIAGLIVTIVIQFMPTVAQASAFQMAVLRLDREAASTASKALVCARPASTATEASVKVTFPTTSSPDFTFGAAGTFTVTSSLSDPTDPLPATINGVSVTVWPSIATATNVTGHTVTFPSGDLTVGTLYCFEITGGLTTGAAGTNLQASIATYTSGAVLIDTTPVALAVVTNDQIAVSAIVPPSFSFSLSGNSDAFTTNLSPTSAIGTTGVTVSAATNAKSGWVAWAKDSQQGLFSTSAAYKINSVSSTGAATTLVNGTEQYGSFVGTLVQATNTGHCTLTATAPYNGSATAVGGYAASFTQMAACVGGTSNGNSFIVTEEATISSATAAGSDYADVITVVGAGLF